MASGLKHNKRRNTGLVYEFLVRQLGRQMVDQDAVGASKTLGIFREFFAPGTPLSREREVFETVMASRNLTEAAARKILGEVERACRKIDNRRLDENKTRLIHEVHAAFGRDFYDRFRLPQYRLLASIQIFADTSRRGNHLSENVQKIGIEEALVTWMTSGVEVERGFSRDREIDDLVVGLAAKKFEERYGKELTDNQRGLLETYSRAFLTEDFDSVTRRMFDDRKKILKVLDENRESPAVKSDSVALKKYEEVRQRLVEMDVTRATDESVEEMLLYWRLAEEVSSDE